MLRDKSAFSSLIAIHQGKVRAFLLRLTQDYDGSMDIAQDTFITAFQKISQFKGKNSIGGWLMKIAYNHFLQARRSGSRRDEIGQRLNSAYEIQEAIYESISPEQLDLETALAKLKPEQSSAITLCHSFGYSHKEAAEILGIPIGTVKTNILRGKEKLVDILRISEKKAHS